MTGWRMQPTASALGVIAIVSVMITATASEAENGAIEHGINHPGGGEEDRRFTEDERIANETRNDEAPPFYPRNDTSEREELVYSTARIDLADVSTFGIFLDGLQGDQSEGVYRNTLESLQKPLENAQDTTVSSTENRTDDTRKNEEDLAASSKRIEETDRKDSFKSLDVEIRHTEESKLESSTLSTFAVQTHSEVTESRIDRKNIEDIKAISFQVPIIPAPNDVVEEDTEKRRHNVEETKKEHSRTVNNLILGGKSTKAFYEIKPSIKTEMEKIHERRDPPTTQRSLTARKFVLPSDSAFGKFGPYFEDGDEELNITARIGSTVLLDCKIGMLGDKKVTWLQHSKDSFRLLTVGMTPYSVDQRISLNFRYPSNWRLQILYTSPRDSGLYKCQVATHPPLVKKINVIVTAPALTIMDDSGRIMPKERHLKAGSVLKLRCEAKDVLESQNESVVWTRGDETLTEDVSENRTTEISSGKEVLVIVSTLIVERASPRHAGNYSCVVPGKAKTTIAVHVLNGELPAAVHDGNGVSRAFLNLWLIHLAMSYVFSR